MPDNNRLALIASMDQSRAELDEIIAKARAASPMFIPLTVFALRTAPREGSGYAWDLLGDIGGEQGRQIVLRAAVQAVSEAIVRVHDAESAE
jgi:hypothetical protein